MTDLMLRIFFNWLILHMAGLSSQVFIYNRCFPLRHNYTVWALYFCTRGLLRSYLSAVMATGNMSHTLFIFDVVFVFVTAVTNFVVLWYTWEGDPIKICMAGIVSDLITGTAMVLCIGTANLLEHGKFAPDMITLSTGYTTAAAAGLFLMVVIMVNLLNPLIRWFHTAKFLHRRVLSAIIILAIALFSSTNLTDTAGFDGSSYIVCIIGVLLLVPLGGYILKTIDIQRNRRVLLRQQAEMNSAYILAVDSQYDSIATYRKLLDSLSEQIDSSDTKLTSDELRRYINDLRLRADRLRSGAYSSNIAVEAVLSAFAVRFEALGCKADLKADELGEEDTNAAEISWILLNWAESSMDEKGERPAGGPRMIRYRIIRQADQRIFSLILTGAEGKAFSERALRGHIGKTDVINCRRNGSTVTVEVMTSESGTKAKEAV